MTLDYDKPNGRCSHCGSMLNQHLISVTVMRESVIEIWESVYNKYQNKIWSNEICFDWNEI